MSDLKTNLQEILQEKQDKIIPENIKKDVQIFDVTGTLESGAMTEENYQLCLQLADDIMGNLTPEEGNIYGIKRLRTSSDPSWERTDNAIGKVANATHDGTEVQNDFDTLYPWSEIKSFNYNSSTDEITAYYGDDNFTFTPSDSNINVFTKIPEFWYQRTVDGDGYEYIKIADYSAPGFTKSNSFAVGRYITSGETKAARSISGSTPMGKQTPNDFRTINKTMGEKVHLFDIKSLGVIQILYLVEYASYYAQDKLGNGYVSGSSIMNNGTLDDLGMKSGCLVNDSTGAVIYRGIENIYGNAYIALDGINIRGDTNESESVNAYINYDYNNYDYSNISEPYLKLNYNLLSYGTAVFISELGYDENNPSIMLPTKAENGSESTYITDAGIELRPSETTMIYFGGGYTQGQRAGMFRYLSSMTADTVGGTYRCSRAVLELN